MKIEFGSGDRPEPGYFSCDVNPGKNVDFVGNPWELNVPCDNVERFLALGVMEHLTYADFRKTLDFVYTKLKLGGEFFFDVPDLPIWCKYYVDATNGESIPFTIEHVLSTLFGWQRWPGDEHKSGWSQASLRSELNRLPWQSVRFGVDQFLDAGYVRRRMTRPGDAHIYVYVMK
jgi:predicted SAM-dependent methyltransferase